jgi:AraC-like DNA-binding protein
MVYSNLSDFDYKESVVPAFGIKYLYAGEEIYQVNGETRKVRGGQYLYVNANERFSCSVAKTEVAEGLCFGINQAMLNDVWRNCLDTDHALLDDPFTNNHRFEAFNFIHSDTTAVGQVIRQINLRSGRSDITDALYYALGVAVVKDETGIQLQARQLSVKKRSTREELFRRMLSAKQFMDAFYLDPITLPGIASAALLSEFHFMRTYKKLFGISPYQYMVQKRLQHSLLLLKKGCPVSEIATTVGFGDIYSFSKAFKKQFSIAPSRYFPGSSGRRHCGCCCEL